MERIHVFSFSDVRNAVGRAKREIRRSPWEKAISAHPPVPMKHLLPNVLRRAAVAATTVLICGTTSGQTVFSAPSAGGGFGLFEQRGATVLPLVTGQTEHYHPWISRSGRYISFSAPDPTVLGSIPSSDVYVFDRTTGVTHRVINHSTGVDGLGGSLATRAISSAVSPDHGMLAYAVVLQGSAGGATAAGRALNVVLLGNGLSVGTGFGVSETPADSLQAEFMGISWDPGGNSFVTPTYVLLGSLGGFPQSLPAIVRWTRQPGGNWSPTRLSNPQFINNNFGVIYHIYPAVSPSGAGLAWFSVLVPDAIGSSQPAQISLVRANADGTNATVLGTFTPGGGNSFFPAGLDWSTDGSRLVFSICRQTFTGVGWTTAADLASAVTYSVDSTTGQDFRAVEGLTGAAFPSVGPFISFASPAPPRLSLERKPSGGFLLRANGLNPAATYFLRSSTTLEPGSFGAPQSFTGQQLMNGIDVPLVGSRRFFRVDDS